MYIYYYLLLFVLILLFLFIIINYKKKYDFLIHDKYNKLQELIIKNEQNIHIIINNLKIDIIKNIYNIYEQERMNNILFQESFNKDLMSYSQNQKEKLKYIQEKQEKLISIVDKKFEQIRETVDEKLQKTLNERIGSSFQTVNNQLISVQKGLGEMQVLTKDVISLKKILSNVKMYGNLGELQLSMLLDQILAPDQYQANVKTKRGSSYTVEFAIKLPGKNNKEIVWIPIDAKFPKDAYEKLQYTYDLGDLSKIDAAKKNLEIIIKKMAKNIKDKYIDPPNTTDFGILFLPFEGIYSEIVKKAKLLDELQRIYKIIVTGPTTLAAILNSFQIGFRTLAIQKRSSEVWQILSDVKREFYKFSDLLINVQKHIRSASDQIEEVSGKRTRLMKKKLNDIEILDHINQ